MEFLTIDFETASRYEYSPCAVSVYRFNNDKITQLLSTLINPGDVYFEPSLTELHGITKEMVQNAPNIEGVLKNICNLINHKFVFAHNAPFDISQLISGCNEYDINIPYFEYADSLMVAKRTWSKLINYKLDTVSDYLNIDLQHHNSASDAIACGKIVMAALNEHSLTDINELLEKIRYVKGYYDNSWYHAYSKKLYNKSNGNSISDYEKIKDIKINSNTETQLSGKYVVFTGTLKITRKEAMQLVADKGGIPEGGVTKNTNYLIVGRDDYGNFKEGNKSNKMLKAEKLIQNGQDLEIITEDDFFELLN